MFVAAKDLTHWVNNYKYRILLERFETPIVCGNVFVKSTTTKLR